MTSSSPDVAGLRSLAKLVNQSVETIIAEYAKENSQVPSLNFPGNGPLDAAENCSPELVDAIKILEGACAQLSATCTSPGRAMVNRALTLFEPACFNFIIRAKIADILGDSEEGLHTSELAKRTGVDQAKLTRILRLLATTNVFREVKQDVFANNRLSVKLKTTEPVSAMLAHLSDEVFVAATKISETLNDPEWTSAAGIDRSPFYRAFNVNLFGLLASPKEKDRAERFNMAMVGWGQVAGASTVPAKVYPWHEAGKGATVCDVGGGNGHVMLGLLKVHTQLSAVIQDVPAVIDEAKKFWDAELPKAVTSNQVKFLTMDFFQESPVKDCAYYYLGHVLHDWSDDDALKILQNVRKAMKPTSKLLLQEFVLQELIRDKAQAANQAPEPLLANYGVGRVIPYYVDIHMFSTFNATERSLKQFLSLGERSGFKFSRQWDCGEVTLLEFVQA